MKKAFVILLVMLLFCCSTNAEENVERKGNALWTYTIEEGSVTLTGYFGSEAEVIIPETLDGLPVTAIAEECFRGCTLVMVTIPECVEQIGSLAFAECGALTTAFLHSASLEVDESAFLGCNHLSVLLIEDDDALLAGNAFEGCSSLRLIIGGTNSEAEELSNALGILFAAIKKEEHTRAEKTITTDSLNTHEDINKPLVEKTVTICEWVSSFEEGEVRAKVTAQGSAGLRPRPNKKEPYFARLTTGSVVQVLSIEDNGWLHILTEEDVEGYISGKLAEIDWNTLMPYYSSFVRIRGTGFVNVHRFADVSSLDLARVQVGKIYPVMGVARNGWFKILLDDGCTQGYISDSMAEYIGSDWRPESM